MFLQPLIHIEDISPFTWETSLDICQVVLVLFVIQPSIWYHLGGKKLRLIALLPLYASMQKYLSHFLYCAYSALGFKNKQLCYLLLKDKKTVIWYDISALFFKLKLTRANEEASFSLQKNRCEKSLSCSTCSVVIRCAVPSSKVDSFQPVSNFTFKGNIIQYFNET